MLFTSQGRSVLGKTIPSVLCRRPRAQFFPTWTDLGWWITYIYFQNISGNAEDLLSYPKVVIKKETFTANYGSTLRIFTRNSVSTTCKTRSRGAKFEHTNLVKINPQRFTKLISPAPNLCQSFCNGFPAPCLLCGRCSSLYANQHF